MLTIPAYYLISPLFITTRVNEPLPSTGSLTPILQGSLQGAGGHSASGTFILYRTESGSYVIRFENFAVTNGPNLNVYLSRNANPGQDFIDLGDLKGTNGTQNYNLPSGVDVQQYRVVLIWCVTFSVLFGSANLQ